MIFLKTKTALEVKWKIFYLKNVLPYFRLKKQTSKNVADKTFNNIPVVQINSQHLGMQLGKKLNFEEHLNNGELKVIKAISVI